jgi:probable HAF family extracellular repeat protein
MRLNTVVTLSSFVTLLALSAACLAPAQITYNFKTIDVPGTAATSAYANNNMGHIVGEYSATDHIATIGGGFLLSQGVFKNLAFPGAIRTSPEGINAKGQVVGIYIDKSGASHGFQWKGTTYASIDFPGSVLTYANSINQSGVIVGGYYDGARFHGFMLQGTHFTTIDFQPAVGGAAGSIAGNINDQGQVVGA